MRLETSELKDQKVEISRQMETSRRGFPKYEVNPSVPLHVDASRKTKKIEGAKGNFMVIADVESGSVATEALPAGFYTVDFVDKEKFVKLFLEGVKAFSGLSSAGIKVFEVLYREVQENANSDSVVINYEAVSISTNIARRTFFRGLKELLVKQFIYESIIPNRYFVNINYIFNGNRLAFVKEYHLKEKKKNAEQAVLPGFEELPAGQQASSGQ